MRVSKDALKLLRALAGDDTVKSNILKNDGARLIDEIINIHKVKWYAYNNIEIEIFQVFEYAK